MHTTYIGPAPRLKWTRSALGKETSQARDQCVVLMPKYEDASYNLNQADVFEPALQIMLVETKFGTSGNLPRTELGDRCITLRGLADRNSLLRLVVGCKAEM